jgi:hypothetical protein
MRDPISIEDTVKESEHAVDPLVRRKSRRAHVDTSAKSSNLQREFLLRLQHLRSAAKEASRQYLANIERDIVVLADLVKESRSGGRKGNRVKNPTLEYMIAFLDDLSVRPEKGRRKDLKRIEEAIHGMTEAVRSGRK